MSKILILCTFLCLNAKAQDYAAIWSTVAKETGVVNYQVQRSSNNITWATIATIQPKKSTSINNYEYILPAADNYIRVKALMTNNIAYTIPIKVKNTNVVISNTQVNSHSRYDNISFTASNEAAVSYYSIEKNSSSTGNNWSIAGKLMQTNKKNYTVNIYGNGRRYRMISVYKNGIKSDYINF